MYTGIIDYLGEIIAVNRIASGLQLIIQTTFDQIKLGESIAVNGICLTVSEIKPQQFTCELSPETLKLTTAKAFAVGQKVNLERSMQLQDRVGGHFVMGHIDTTATIKQIEKQGDFHQITVSGFTKEAMHYIIKKGSISVDGISLTINDVSDDSFVLMIIPHTWQVTNIQYWHTGDSVNIEFDSIARVVVDQIKRMQLNITTNV